MKRKPRKPLKGATLEVTGAGELVARPQADTAADPLWTLWKALSNAAGGLKGPRPLNRADREDVASEGLESVLKKRKQNRSYATTAVGGFARRTSRNLLIKQLRASRVRERDAPAVAYEMEIHQSSYGNPELEFDGNELMALIDRGVATLPEELGKAWYMRRIEGREVKYIAKHFAISESLASNRICRAAVLMVAYVELHLNVQPPEKQS
jgi:RNA polymerase sigma factor (sigma-70 family)